MKIIIPTLALLAVLDTNTAKAESVDPLLDKTLEILNLKASDLRHIICTGNCVNGKGTAVYPSGKKYVGEFKNGKHEGQGTYIDGIDKYEGEWKEGKKNGQGIQTTAGDFSKYEGGWKEGKRDGHGIQTDGDLKKYEGEWKNGEYDGHGILTHKNISKYEGEWKEGKEDGYGVKTYASGRKYEGEWKNGKYDGHGTEAWEDGHKYEGEWKEGKYNGHGIKTYKDAHTYEGEWKNGERDGQGIVETPALAKGCIIGDCINGQGTFIEKNGDKYEGEWKNGKYDGQGTYTDTGKGGYKYEGKWKNGKYDGHGTEAWEDGHKYEGGWKNGHKEGQGTLIKKDGSKYEGEWKHGSQDGQGTYTDADGCKYEGKWKNDKEDGYGIVICQDGAKYEGEWKNGKYDGQGTLIWQDGSKYEGEWKNGRRDGQGTLINNEDGSKYVGKFKNDERDGQGTLTTANGNTYAVTYKYGEDAILANAKIPLLPENPNATAIVESKGATHLEEAYLHDLANAEKKRKEYIEGKYRDPSIAQSNDSFLSDNLLELADFYVRQGRYEKAEPLYLRSLSLMERTEREDAPLNRLAELYQKQGRYDKAEVLYLRSLKLHENSDVLANLADTYSAQGKYQQAEPLYRKSVEISLANGLRSIRSVISLGELYLNQGELSKAKPLLQKGLALQEKQHDDIYADDGTRRHMANLLAKLYQKQGTPQKAEPLYLRSLAAAEKILKPDDPEIANTLNLLAGVYVAQAQYEKAEPLYKRSLRVMDQALGHLLWGAGDKTRQAYLQQQEANRNTYLSFYSLRNTPEEALYFSLSRKGLLLRIASEVSNLAKQSADPAIAKQIQEFNTLKTQLSTLALSGKADDKAKIQELEEKSNTLEMLLSQNIADIKRSQTEVTPAQVLEKLNAEQTLVDFLIYKEVDLKTQKDKTEQVIALIADKQNGIKLIKLGELASIAGAIKTYRQTILPTPQGQLANREDILKPASQKLYQLIWQPLLPYLANKKQVYLIPDGVLHLLPFKALQDEQGHYLAEKQQITLLSSARDIVLPPLTGKSNDSVIFAAPVFGEKESKTVNTPTRSVVVNRQELHFDPLEGAAAEGKALSDLIKTKQSVQVFQEKQATETNVDAIKAPRFLHFATHGFFLENIKPVETKNFSSLPSATSLPVENIENPLTRSGLALTGANFGIKGQKQADGTDGILTALEVLALNLEGTDLVTLSACETGVGDIQVGEGVYSLNRAFQEAGAKSVLSTLWSVADDQTKQFMQEFYMLVLNGESPQQALQKTQLKFINDKILKDPFFWAAFTVVGI